MPMIKWVLITVSFFIVFGLNHYAFTGGFYWRLILHGVCLHCFFWTYGYSRYVNVGVAWCIGVFVDGLTGTLLGMHAFFFCSG
ncbi:MAG: rod shape-determining protein MreD, partial [Gammaproteobacteria bacterium]|nr:rod shape-determining protein MreD [Gammaproteobacteria bacterium]